MLSVVSLAIFSVVGLRNFLDLLLEKHRGFAFVEFELAEVLRFCLEDEKLTIRHLVKNFNDARYCNICFLVCFSNLWVSG